MAERLIRESDVLKNIDEWLETVGYATIGKNLSYYAELKGCIEDAPTIEAKPVRHGRWIDAYPDIEPNPMFMYGICSECGFEQGISKYLNYCPNCGAQMDEEED